MNRYLTLPVLLALLGSTSVSLAQTAAPPTKGTLYYCMVWSEDGDRLPAPSGKGLKGFYKVTAADNGAALPLAADAARKYHGDKVDPDSAECETNIDSFNSH
jgi:hypothetical protein